MATTETIRISLLYESNKVSRIAVKTPSGLTRRVNLPCIVQQGGTWGSILCSNSIDTLGKRCKLENRHIYMYKKTAEILPLSFVDDLLSISKCGDQSVQMNSYLNTHIELKKLRFHVTDVKGNTKCHKMHIGKRNPSCPLLKLHGTVMPEVKEEKYLGDIVSCDGKNTKNIRNRISKGLGAINQIFNILKSVYLGRHYFEVALLLRQSLLLSKILTNAEIWYNLRPSEICELESMDKSFFQKLLKVPQSTPSEAFFLELGVLPIGTIIKFRRICYLHNVLKRKKSSMLYRFFITQWLKPCRGDWVLQVQRDLQDFQIVMDLDEISSYSKDSFKRLVKSRGEAYTFAELSKIQALHSKLKNLNYVDISIRQYFQDENLTVDEKITVFKYRTRMAKYGNNFKQGKSVVQKCPVCLSHIDNQELSFHCSFILKKIEITNTYEDIFIEAIDKNLAETLTKIDQIRDHFIT